MARNRVSLSLAAAAALALAGCATQEGGNRSPSTPVAAGAPGHAVPSRPGTGTVESVSKAPAPMPSAARPTDSAAAGASAPQTWYRLGVRMQNGSMQYIDTNSTEFPVGTRIQLTEDRLIRQP
jgi:hypothetical protein